SIGRLFMAGIIPGIMLTGLFMAWSLYYAKRKGFHFKIGDKGYSWKEKFEILPKILPFLMIIVLVLYALYGGVATPSEAAGIGAFVCIGLVVLIYKMWNLREHWEILRSAMRESVMIMMIIGSAALFSYMMSSLYITQSLAEGIATLDVSPWVLLLSINFFLLLAGLFLPPVAVILMAAPTLVPIVETIGFDPIWFGVMLTLNMEIGLITPPVGLNLYVINSIAPDIKLPTILWGALPFMICMLIGIALLIMFPGLATWLPDYMMGPAQY
ncbi:MAG: TRAP transporter large permease, partial [Gammaproteobacteria bacterium]|nr:TRAP transporter large permease [Gammaproteobacteria bacterium]